MDSLLGTNLNTVRDLLRFAVSCFNHHTLSFGHGTNNAYDEAVYLILSTLKLPIDILDPFLDACLLPDEINAVWKVIKQRTESRIPAAYLTHEAWQGGFSFYVDPRVLIPRSFIFELFGEALAPWINRSESIQRALDLCTGSACLAIELAHCYPQAQIDAADLSTDALEVAAINVQRYQLEERITLIHSDLFARLQGRYDLIIANPPYVGAAAMASLPAEYRHEPIDALRSGEDGLDATRRILQHAPAFLSEHGILIVEIGHHRALLEQTFPTLPFVWLPTASGKNGVFLLTRQDLS